MLFSPGVESPPHLSGGEQLCHLAPTAWPPTCAWTICGLRRGGPSPWGPPSPWTTRKNGPVQVVDQQLQPQEAVERSERRRALSGAGLLPDHHRQVLIMRELSGLSYQEIAQVLT